MQRKKFTKFETYLLKSQIDCKCLCRIMNTIEEMKLK